MSENYDNEKSAVLAFLKAGGSLKYFFLHGGVALHNPDSTPNREQTVSIGTFLSLRDEKLIEFEEQRPHGWPYYADSHKHSVYVISDKGRIASGPQ